MAGGEEAVPAGDLVPRVLQGEGEVGGGVSQQQSGGPLRGRPGRWAGPFPGQLGGHP